MHLLSALWRVFVPTTAQALGSILVALAAIIILQSRLLLDRLGISPDAIGATQSQFVERYGAILSSPITGKIVLLAFWSAVGLVVYLVCWGAYNLYVTARNEVTIETQYANRSHWDGPWGALILKVLAALIFLAYVTMFTYGLSVWLALSAPVFHQTMAESVIMATAAVIGLAGQLYLGFVLLQLLFSPWYTNLPFTPDES